MDAMEPPDGQAGPPDGAASRAPFWGLALAVLALVAFFLIRPAVQDLPYYRPRPGGRTYDYWQLVLLAFGPYAWALRAVRRGMRVPVRLLLGVAAAVYVAAVPAPAQQSQDVYQYLVYGRMAVEGISPYAAVPADAPNGWLAFSSWHDTASVYGPAWTFASQLAVAATGSLTGAFLLIKAVAGALAVTAAAGLARADRTGDGFAPLAFALNPFVVVSAGIGAHADVAIAAAFAWAIVADRQGRPWTATGLLVAAALVKPYAAIALLVWLVAVGRRQGAGRAVAHAAASAIAGVAAFAPYWGDGALRGLAEVGRRVSASLTGSAVRLIAANPDSADAGAGAAGAAGRAVAAAAMVAGIAWAVRSARTRDRPWEVAAAVSMLYVLVTPWYLYWHLLGALVLVVAAGGRALTAATLTFSATSLVVVAAPMTSGFQTLDLIAQTAIRYGPPVGAGLLLRGRYTRARADRGPRGDAGGLRGGHVPARGARAAEGPRDA